MDNIIKTHETFQQIFVKNRKLRKYYSYLKRKEERDVIKMMEHSPNRAFLPVCNCKNSHEEASTSVISASD